ncbi:substrate-binding and VWA domain-containing protein [Streptomyces tubbatahanensis]|uniref:Substrate-binding and VWA domain-containing protein n=1 Tax=Streptomyces tubbatahanensis TaxID=2923272 RepID=A0ABY3XMW6_9ACTN|nr:substrate-binding domain-containing protein [Streptomyces tubbatahanensis]UNS95766.1 substrate-binding and VWA domain-containing protein [Streptomyces tubbatahanensis]
MPRHSLPDDSGAHGPRGPHAGKRSGRGGTHTRHGTRGRARRRTVFLAVGLVVALGAGTIVATRTGVLPFGGACDGSTVELRVAAAPAIAPALRAVADRAREENARSDGQCLDVHVGERTGAEMAAALRRGGGKAAEDFDVWLPDSRIWTDRASSSSGRDTGLRPLGSVASSPLTLAAVPAAAEEMGWPGTTYSWAQLATAANGEGDLRVGTADPVRSATGLLALTRIQSATAGKDADASRTAAAAAARQLAERTAPGDSQVLATLPHDTSGAELGNPRRNQALLLSEQAAYAHNRKRGGAPGLRLFYPGSTKDGSTALDFPYTLLETGERDTATSRAATRFQTLLGSAAGRRELRRHGFRPPDGEAAGGVARTAGARAPQPYTATPGEPPATEDVRTALGMWTITVQSARFTLVVDASASMAAPVPGRPGRSRMDVTKASLTQGLTQFTPQDEVGLWEFSTRLARGRDYRELVPPRRLGHQDGDGVTQRSRLTKAFAGMEPIPGGATGLYDTTLAAYEQARKQYAKGRFNALVVLTDGANEDPGSISRAELVAELEQLSERKAPLPLIAIAVGPDADEKAAEELAKATGGSAHRVSDPAQIHQVILKAIVEAGSRG